VRGTAQSLRFDTVVAPIQGPPQGISGVDGDPGIVSITMFPNPVNVDEDGNLLQDVGITVRLRHYPATSFVTVTWADDDVPEGGTPKERSLYYSGLNSWTTTIPREAITFVPPDEDPDPAPTPTPEPGEDPEEGGLPGLVFTVHATDGAGQEDDRDHKLKVQLISGELPSFSSATVTTPIEVNKANPNHGCGTGNACENTHAVILTAVVSNLDGDQVDAVKARWTRWGGATGEIALRQDPANPNRWTETVARHTDTFQAGTNNFVFIATRASDRAEGTTSRAVTVNVK
jgi:hypothetical protein